MPRYLAPFVLALFLAGPAAADDASDIQTVIASQLKAFKAGDGAGAYSFAAPSIKRMFPSPDVFMSMVRSGYPAVANSSNVTFGPMRGEGSVFRQEVYMTDGEGRSYIASYTLERQPDGTLKITSCSIRKGEDVAA